MEAKRDFYLQRFETAISVGMNHVDQKLWWRAWCERMWKNMQLISLFIFEKASVGCVIVLWTIHDVSLINHGKADPCTHSATQPLYPAPFCRFGGVDLCFCVNVAIYEPFVVCEFVAMVIPGDNVHQEYVLGFWVESCDLHLVTGEHPPTGNIVRENYQHSLSKTFKHPKDKTSPCQAHLSQRLDQT